jgi:hypothetical protein
MTVWALTLFLMAVMVFGTLGLAFRIREKIEAQHVADTAAYSAGVAVARTFNTIAVLNRGVVSHMVAMAGVQSLISWSGLQYGMLQQTQNALGELESAYNDCCADAACPAQACACAEGPKAGDAKNKISPHIGDVDLQWQLMDQAAADQAVAIQGAAKALVSLQEQMLADAKTYLTRDLVAGLADLANAPDLFDPLAGDLTAPAVAEVDRAVTGTDIRQGIRAAMGARGYEFVTSRKLEAHDFADDGMTIIQQPGPGQTRPFAMIFDAVGGSGFGETAGREAGQFRATVTGLGAWGDDHLAGPLTIRWLEQCVVDAAGAIPESVDVNLSEAWVFGTGLANHEDMHVWPASDDSPPDVRHTFPGCDIPGICETHGMYPGYVGYNAGLVANRGDLFAQPLMVVGVQRDYTRVPRRPWDLLVNFRFTPTGGSFDSGFGDYLTYGGADISKQTALAGAIVYYHRPVAQGSGIAGWKEAPNLFNPFWRSTLYQTGQPPQGPLEYLDHAGLTSAAETFRALRANGFRGVQ